MSSLANVRRLLRTTTKLHPLQVLGRPYHAVARRGARWLTSRLGPAPRAWSAPPPAAIAAFVAIDAARARARLDAAAIDSRLRAYEAAYGYDATEQMDASWQTAAARESFPSSVRARQIALAMWLGHAHLAADLTIAARAILVQVEVHLLGNHLLENGFGLAAAGAAAVGTEADLWWRVGAAILDWQLARQFLADGGHAERSVSYHLAVTAALVETIAISVAAGRDVPDRWRQIARRAVAWAMSVRAPDGTYPLFNDAALDAAPSIDQVLALAHALDLAPTQSAPPPRISRLEPTGWLRIATPRVWLMIDAGPDCWDDQPGHAHADGLTFELWLDGVRTVVDFGIATYEAGDLRDQTRATRSHNTVALADTDSCEVWSAFRVGRRGTGRVLRAEDRDGIVSVELEHDGYAWMPGAPRHHRTLTLGDRYLEIVDTVAHALSPWTSTLRFDRVAADCVRVTGGCAEPGVWYPGHGIAQPAIVYTQSADRDARWRIEW